MYMNNNKLYQNGNFLLKVGFTVHSSIERALNILFSTDMIFFLKIEVPFNKKYKNYRSKYKTQVSMIYGLMDQCIDDNLRGEGDRSLLKLTI